MRSEFLARKKFVRVNACDIPIGDKTIHLDPFDVAWLPITIGEFQAFCDQSGYITEAERCGSKFTFRNNPLLEFSNKKKNASVEDLPAGILSFNDASDFCNFCGVQLPSDVQWLAASVVEWKTVYPDATAGYRANFQRARIIGHGYEWTCSPADSSFPTRSAFEIGGTKPTDLAVVSRPDDVIVRYGPVYALFEGWWNTPLRMRAPRSFYSEWIGIRVVKLI